MGCVLQMLQDPSKFQEAYAAWDDSWLAAWDGG